MPGFQAGETCRETGDFRRKVIESFFLLEKIKAGQSGSAA